MDAATGKDLDMLASTNYGIHRRPGETDDRFRRRISASSFGYEIRSVKLGPISLHDSDHARRVAELLRTSSEGHHTLRQALEMIIRVDNYGVGHQDSIEQPIYDLALTLKERGVIHDGVSLPNGKRTPAWVDTEALDTWLAATLLIMDDEA